MYYCKGCNLKTEQEECPRCGSTLPEVKCPICGGEEYEDQFGPVEHDHRIGCPNSPFSEPGML